MIIKRLNIADVGVEGERPRQNSLARPVSLHGQLLGDIPVAVLITAAAAQPIEISVPEAEHVETEDSSGEFF